VGFAFSQYPTWVDLLTGCLLYYGMSTVPQSEKEIEFYFYLQDYPLQTTKVSLVLRMRQLLVSSDRTSRLYSLTRNLGESSIFWC
jgi:hypothetical protein